MMFVNQEAAATHLHAAYQELLKANTALMEVCDDGLVLAGNTTSLVGSLCDAVWCVWCLVDEVDERDE